MVYPRAKFGELVSAVLISSCGQNHRSHTEADDRYTHATTVGVSNELWNVHCSGAFQVCFDTVTVTIRR